MRRTGLLYDERFMLHCTGAYHPEAPERLECAHRGLTEADLLDVLIPIKAVHAQDKWIEAVHSTEYINRLKDACACGSTEFEHPDNQMCKDTFDVALLAVGGILEAVRLVMERTLDNAFCCVRPPGHHAEVDHALGFCYFNNVAIAAKYLQRQWGIERIGIVDFDVHHGNGTQHIFESDPSVFYYSIHEHPSFSYPGTGREFEKGTDAGVGFTLNSPVLPGQGDRKYKELIERDLLPAFDAFKPEVVLVSAGFDAHVEDDMSGVAVSTGFFTWIMEKIVELAAKHSEGRLVSILEGGYCLQRLPELVGNHVSVLLGKS